MHTILEALLALGGLRSSTPLHIIGGIIDRGFSLNDYDVVALDNSLALARLVEAPPPGLHLIPRSWLSREVLPPSAVLGSKRLWDYAEASGAISTPEGVLSLAGSIGFLEAKVRGCNSNIKSINRGLSVGFGEGAELALLALVCQEVVGIESSPQMVAVARARGYEVYLMDMNLLDFEDGEFDLYFSHHALEHSVAPCLALGEAHRVLRPGGRLLLVAPVGYDHPAHRYNFTPEMVENMVRTAGFSMEVSLVERARFFDQVRVMATKDGEGHQGQSLQDPEGEEGFVTLPGIYLVEPHGEMVGRGEKRVIVKSRRFTKYQGQEIAVVTDGKERRCYAIIIHQEPEEISLEEFEAKREEHRITEEERKKWWPDAEVLWAYSFTLQKAFQEPIPVEIPQGVQVWIEGVKIPTY